MTHTVAIGSTVGMGSQVEVVLSKYPDQPHYRYTAVLLGEDEHGAWLRCDTGDHVYRGAQLAYVRDISLLALVPTARHWWLAMWYPPSQDRYEVYVNINTPPQWIRAHRVEMIDLDLDVERWRDGTIDLLDEDEFAEHSARHAYPNELIAATWEATRTVTSMLETGAEPFAGAWKAWYQRCFPTYDGPR
jgi:uncharacterized protein